jgi:hypothetical protein
VGPGGGDSWCGFPPRLWEGDRGKDTHGHFALSRSVIRAGVFLFWRGGRFCFGG